MNIHTIEIVIGGGIIFLLYDKHLITNQTMKIFLFIVIIIILHAKMLKQTAWNSLSIPKNKSTSYNADKFAKEKSLKHFTDDELKKLQ